MAVMLLPEGTHTRKVTVAPRGTVALETPAAPVPEVPLKGTASERVPA